MDEQRRQLITLSIVFMIGMAGAAVIFVTAPMDSDDGDTETVYIKDTANRAPVAAMFASSTQPFIGDEVTFDASSSRDLDGTIVAYLWDFGDGNGPQNTSEETKTHVFEDVMVFEVTLRVLDDNDTWCEAEMKISISVLPLDDIDDINPSHRSLESEEEAEELLEEDPLAGIPEVPVTLDEQDKEEFKNDHITQNLPEDPNYEQQTITEENRPSPDYPDPDFDLELEETDLEDQANSNKGIDYAEAALTTEGDFTNDINGQVITAENFDEVGGEINPVKDIKKNYRKTEEKKDPALHKHTAYKSLYVVDAQNYDNNTDGIHEFAAFTAVSYQMVGHRGNPVYESFYVFTMVVWDNNSDGKAEFLHISGFGYESYDKNGDGNVEFAYVHITKITVRDPDSNGQANFGHFFEGEYMKVDANSDGIAEAQKGDFKDVLIYNNGSTEHANFLKSNKWGFVAVDRDGDENNEYALVYGEKFIALNNDTSTEDANFGRYEFYTAISIDINDDGEPGREILAYEKWQVLNPDGDTSMNYIGYDKIYIVRSQEAGRGFVHGENVRMYDNDTNGFYEYQGFEKFSYLYRDQDNDGNREFEGLHYQGIKIWDNKTGDNPEDPQGDGTPEYATAVEIIYYGRDTDDNGDKDEERFILVFFVSDNDDSDGSSGEFMVHYDSNDEI